MLKMARTTTGWSKKTSFERTISARKNSNSVPVNVNPTISWIDEITLCCMTVITVQGFTAHDDSFHGIYLFPLILSYAQKKGSHIRIILTEGLEIPELDLM